VTHRSYKKPLLSLACILALSCEVWGNNWIVGNTTTTWTCMNSGSNLTCKSQPNTMILQYRPNRWPNTNAPNGANLTINVEHRTNISLSNAYNNQLRNVNISVQNKGNLSNLTFANRFNQNIPVTLTLTGNASNITLSRPNAFTLNSGSGIINNLTQQNQQSRATINGKVNNYTQRQGTTTMNNGGSANHYRQSGGITTINNGTITTFTQTGGTTTQSGGTITTFDQNHANAIFNQNGGSITTLNQQNGKVTLNNNANVINFNQSGGTSSLAQGSNVTTFNQAGGNTIINDGANVGTLKVTGGTNALTLENGSNITALSQEDGTLTLTLRKNFSNTYTKENGTANIIANTNTIDKLTQNDGNTNLMSGTITTLTNTGGDVNNESGTIATLTSNQGGNVINKGTITFLTYKAAPTTKAIQTKANTDLVANEGQIDTFDNTNGIVANMKNATITTLTNTNGIVNNAGTITTLTNTGGDVNNDGIITNTLTNSGVAKITNDGTLAQGITNNQGATATIHNTGTINNKIENKGTATIRNQGKITNGIINDGGTLTVVNDFRRIEGTKNFETIGQIGKTANGVHMENNNNGKLNIPIWYFNKEDYATQEERKNNALLVDGDYANITLENAFVSTHNLDVDKTYNANTFIADKNGNAVGDKINNGQGININKLYSVSGIYTFENYGAKGEYRAIINRDELSGRTLAQSIIYSQRIRNVNLSRILREATTQVFVSGKESETNANGKSLGQLEQLHTNHRDQNSQNHTFVIPYYQNFSADLGSETGKLKSNSSGMLIATQRQLPNDYGVLGIYTGFENADQKVNAQRLEMDGNSYYAGLTYNHSFYEDDLTTYFMNLTTKIDYIERDVTKTYRGYIGSASSTAKVFGYGANARVGFSHYLKNDAKISPQIGFNYLGMHNKPFTLNHLGGTREHYLAQNFNFIDAVATIKYETPWINRFKTAVALGTIINVYKDAKGTLHLDSNVLNAELDIARLYGVVQGGISYDLTKDSDISLGYSGIFSSANTIKSHAFMFRYAWWW
ncbi:hypothetical protein, partial [Campylobacter upsaliensis]